MQNYLKDYQGNKCPIDPQNPLVMIQSTGLSDGFNRGTFVFPISHGNGKKPGDHHTEGYITVSPYQEPASFVGLRIGKEAISYGELVNRFSKDLDYSFNASGFSVKGEVVNLDEAVEQLLLQYEKSQIPEDIRDRTEYSSIVKSEKTENTSGIIFENAEDLYGALILYSKDLIKSSTRTREKFVEDSCGVEITRVKHADGNKKDTITIPYDKLKEQARGTFVEGLINRIKENDNQFYKHFEYEAMGTAFFKSTVKVKPIGDAFMLNLSAAYIGNENEKEMVELLGRDSGLLSVGARYELTPLSNEWVGFDLEKSFADSAIDPEIMLYLAQICAGKSITEFKDLELQKDGLDFYMTIGLGQEDNFDSDLHQIDRKLFLTTEGEGKTHFSFTLRPSDREVVIDPEKKKILYKVRDEIDAVIMKSLS